MHITAALPIATTTAAAAAAAAAVVASLLGHRLVSVALGPLLLWQGLGAARQDPRRHLLAHKLLAVAVVNKKGKQIGVLVNYIVIRLLLEALLLVISLPTNCSPSLWKQRREDTRRKPG